jgi:hypothetical protein
VKPVARLVSVEDFMSLVEIVNELARVVNTVGCMVAVHRDRLALAAAVKRAGEFLDELQTRPTP